MDEAAKRAALINALFATQSPTIRLMGGGGYGQGLLSGGGQVQVQQPLSPMSSMQFSLGGGGAYGTVPTQQGLQRVREFNPSIGINYQKRF